MRPDRPFVAGVVVKGICGDRESERAVSLSGKVIRCSSGSH
jgi:hypothetical protein